MVASLVSEYTAGNHPQRPTVQCGLSQSVSRENELLPLRAVKQGSPAKRLDRQNKSHPAPAANDF